MVSTPNTGERRAVVLLVTALLVLAAGMAALLALEVGLFDTADDDATDEVDLEPTAPSTTTTTPPPSSTTPTTTSAAPVAPRTDQALAGFPEDLTLRAEETVEIGGRLIPWNLGLTRSGQVCLQYLTTALARVCAAQEQPRTVVFATATEPAVTAVTGVVHPDVARLRLVTNERVVTPDLVDVAGGRAFGILLGAGEQPETLDARGDFGDTLFTTPVVTESLGPYSALSDAILAASVDPVPVATIGTSTIDGFSWTANRYDDEWFCLDIPRIETAAYPQTPTFSGASTQVICDTAPIHVQTIGLDLAVVLAAVPGCGTTAVIIGDDGFGGTPSIEVPTEPTSGGTWALLSTTPPFVTTAIAIRTDDGRDVTIWPRRSPLVPAEICGASA
ncbi:MAG: hypothetical protein AAGA90_22885 [Actinomycetota bacterium]